MVLLFNYDPGELPDFIYLVRDGFTPDESSPISLPRQADLYGMWAGGQDANDDFQLASGLKKDQETTWYHAYLVMASYATPSTALALSPPDGYAMYILNAQTTPARILAGFSANSATATFIDAGVGGRGVYNGQIYSGVGPVWWTDGDDLIILTRTTGQFLFTSTGRLFWIDHAVTANADPIYAMVSGTVSPGDLLTNKLAVARLPGASGDAIPGNNTPEAGGADLEITYYDSTPTHNDTGDHAPDFLMKIIVTTQPTNPDAIDISFRYTDSLNRCFLRINWTGRYEMWERINGTTYGKGQYVTTANGDVLHLWVSGGEWALYRNYDPTPILDSTTNKITGNFTATAFLYNNPGTGLCNSLSFKSIMGVHSLLSPNFVSYGLATAILAGPTTMGTDWLMEADFYLEFLIDIVPTSGKASWIKFRIQGANDYLYLRISPTDFQLWEMVGGVPNLLSLTGLGTPTVGQRVTVIGNGITVQGFEDSTLLFNLPVTNFATETGGEWHNSGAADDGGYSDFAVFPLQLSDAPQTPGAAKVWSAFQELIK